MKATGFPSRELLTGAMGTAISAADTKEQGAEAVRIAASLARHNPELLDTLAAAGLDIATSAGVSPAEGIALSLSAGKTARVAAPVAQARNISQAVASMTAARSPTGNRRSAALEAAQLMSAINKAAKDPRGERSRTAAQQLADHLDEFFEIGDERTVAGRKFRVKPAFDPGTVGGRFELLGRDAKLQQQFFDKYNFEAGFENIIRQMMVPGTEQRRVLEETREPGGPFRVDYDTSIVRTMEGLVTGGTPQLTQSTLNAAAQGAKDRHLSDFTRGGVTANIAKDREQGLAASSRYRYFTPFSLGMLSSGFDVPLIGNVPGPARMLARLTNREAEHELAQLKFARQEMALINAPSQMRGEERAAFQLLEELIAINERQLAELKKVSQPKPVGAAAQGERGGQRER
jgi:hypothetical protein